MASAQALCQHGLGEAELLQITEKPSVLIQKLYEHPSITDVDWDSVKDKPGDQIFYLYCWSTKDNDRKFLTDRIGQSVQFQIRELLGEQLGGSALFVIPYTSFQCKST